MVVVSVYNESFNGSMLSGETMAMFSLTFWLLSFLKILVSPEILFGLPVLNKTLSKFHSSTLQNLEAIINDNNWTLGSTNVKNAQDKVLQENIKDSISSYIKEVNKLSTKALFFRNQKASQSDIAANIGIPKSHIVFLFKYHSNLSFSEFRMNSRVQDAITLIEGSFLNAETLESLAYTTGFASYNPFFTAFKKITNYAPQEYVKVKKDLQTFTRDDKVHSLKL
jgi:AraC-like DNA-binding protein